jgi:sec-independent protein translocase protein TatA
MFSGGYEWIIFLFIALLLFGKKLPGAMRSVGQSITEFKKGMNEVPKDSPENLESSDNA